MKVIIILATIALTHGAKLERNYLPPFQARASGGSGSFLQTPRVQGPTFTRTAYNSNFAGQPQAEAAFAQTDGQGNFPQAQYNNVNQLNNFGSFDSRPERAQAALERNAAILRSDSSNDGDTFSYVYETENGIYAEESGVATNGVEAQGGYSYTGDDGRVYSVRYTADRNGFVPQGDHLPTPPPIPVEILKALEQNARDEAAGIFDDGSYNEAKYSANINQYSNYQNQDRFNAYGGNDADSVVVNASGSSRSSSRGPADAAFSGPQSGLTSALTARGPVKTAYLPPFSQRGLNRNGGRQNFDARTGYRY